MGHFPGFFAELKKKIVLGKIWTKTKAVSSHSQSCRKSLLTRVFKQVCVSFCIHSLFLSNHIYLVLKSTTEDDKEAYMVRITSAENEIVKLQSKDDRGGGQRGWRGFVDLRHIQPEKFSGKEEFGFWIKKAKTCLESQLDGVGKCLDAAMKIKEDITEAKPVESRRNIDLT